MSTARELFVLSVLLYTVTALACLGTSKFARIANGISAAGSLVAAAAGAASAIIVLARGGGFTAEFPEIVPFARFDIEVDFLSAVMLLLVSILAAATAIYASAYYARYEHAAGILGFLSNAFVGSMTLVVACSDAFYFLIFWELMTLASYFLVVFDQNEEAIRSGFIYFVVAHVGTAAIMVSFILLFVATGSFGFAAFRTASLPPATRNLVFVLCLLGFGAKAGIVPIHFWLPRAHPAAPSTASALLSGAMVKVAVYGLLRVGLDLLGNQTWWWGGLLVAAGAASTILGVLYAAVQNDVKRMLAYSTVENVGIILMGLGAGMLGFSMGRPVLGLLGIGAGLYHLLNHGFFKSLLFLAAGSVAAGAGTRSMEEMGGLARRMPWTAGAFLVGALAAAAIPPLNGFVSEWLTYQALFAVGRSGLLAGQLLAGGSVVVLALAGGVAALCFVRAYGAVFCGPYRTSGAEQAREAPRAMVAGTAVLALGCVALGVGVTGVTRQLFTGVSSLAKGQGLEAALAGHGTVVLGPGAFGAQMSPALVAVLLAVLACAAAALVAVGGGRRPWPRRRVEGDPWAAGYRYSPEMAYPATGFAEQLRVLFRPAYSLAALGETTGRTGTRWFAAGVRYLSNVELDWDKRVYMPLVRGVRTLARWAQEAAPASVRLYCAYVIAALVLLLLIAAS